MGRRINLRHDRHDMQNNHLYVIPGGGYDHLDTKDLYDNWEPNKFYDYNLLEKIPAGSPSVRSTACPAFPACRFSVYCPASSDSFTRISTS